MSGLEITYLAPCLFRHNFSDDWKAGIFKDFRPKTCNYRPFLSMEGNFYAEIAPLEGNEKMVGKVGDAFGLIDKDELKERGLI